MLITTSRMIDEEIAEEKSVVLTTLKQVGPCLFHHSRLLRLEHQLRGGFAHMAGTSAAHATVVLFAIVNDDNRRCALLQTLSCSESCDDSMSRHASARRGQCNQYTPSSILRHLRCPQQIPLNGYRGHSSP